MSKTASPSLKRSASPVRPRPGGSFPLKSSCRSSSDPSSRLSKSKISPRARQYGEYSLSLEELEEFAHDWLLECELRQHSARTLSCRRDLIGKLLWFLKHRDYKNCGSSQIREFFLYLNKGHEEPEGRWNNPAHKAPMRPESIHSYFKTFRSWFNWLESEELVPANPMRTMKPPVFRSESKQPLTEQQLAALLTAAKASLHPRRDVAILLVLLDTGIRAAECCSLTIGDVDLNAGTMRVTGKGNKIRTVFLGKAATKALVTYLRSEKSESERREPGSPLFTGDRGNRAGQALTPGGLFQLLQRLGQSVGVKAGCHIMRRSCAISMIRNGSSVYAVAAMLGHGSDIQMTRRYVAIADADVQNQHRQFSPVDRLQLRSLSSDQKKNRVL